MNKLIEKGKTLLIDGPAAVTVLSGTVEVFGFQIRNNNRLVIREGKRLPFKVEGTANFSISLGQTGEVEETPGSTIPSSWIEAFEKVRNLQKKPAVVMVIGGVDSGKTSFCTYLTNRLVTEKYKVSVLDEDMGQSDIGPPCTIAYAHVSKPVTDLFKLEDENAFFVGTTSPSDSTKITIEGTATLMKEILSREPSIDFVCVNTDGWVDGEEAIEFKSQLASAVKPDVIFCLEHEDTIPSLCAAFGDALGEFREERAQSPLAVKERNRDKRRSLRELGYMKYLEGAKVKTLSLKRLKIKECTISASQSNAIVKTAGTSVKRITLKLSEEKNLLIGLHDLQNKFLGIGILYGVDFERQMLKVRTCVSTEPACISMGKVYLDENLHEISKHPETQL